MSTVYDHLMEKQSPDGKQKCVPSDTPTTSEAQQESPDRKRAYVEKAPRYKLKLQRHVSEVSASSHGDPDDPFAGNTQSLASHPPTHDPFTGKAQSRTSPPCTPDTTKQTEDEFYDKMFGDLFSDTEDPESNRSGSNRSGGILPLKSSESGLSKVASPGPPTSESGLSKVATPDPPTSESGLSKVATSGPPTPIAGESPLQIEAIENFNLMQESTAAGCHLSSKTGSEALELLLGILASRVPPDDALLVGLVCKGEASPKESLQVVLNTVRMCFKGMRPVEAVQVNAEKRKRPDNFYNVVITCKAQGQQVASHVLKPYEEDRALFNLPAAVRVALAWRCIPLLHVQNISDVSTSHHTTYPAFLASTSRPRMDG